MSFLTDLVTQYTPFCFYITEVIYFLVFLKYILKKLKYFILEFYNFAIGAIWLNLSFLQTDVRRQDC